MNKSILISLMALGLLTACSEQTQTEPQQELTTAKPQPVAIPPKPEPEIPAYEGNAELGELYAKEVCSSCHGLNGIKGRYGSPFIAGQNKTYLVETMLSYLDGSRPLSSMKQNIIRLEEEQLTDIAAYYAGLDHQWNGVGVGMELTAQSIRFNQSDIAAGAAHAKHCNSCHGDNGNSSARLDSPSLAAMPPNYFIYSLKSYFSDQRQHNFMKVFDKSLTEKDIQQMAAYYAVQTPTQAPKPKIGNPKQGAKIVGMDCGGCHGLDGNASNPEYPNLAGQPEEYLISAMLDYRDGRRNDPVMPNAMHGYTDGMINDVAAYYASQKPLKRYALQAIDTYPDLREARRIAKSCDACHGVNGNSHEKGIPSLTGMSVRYLTYSTKAYRDGLWDHGPMQVMTSYLTDQQIEEVAIHYASQQPKQLKRISGVDIDKGEQIAQACALCHSDEASLLDPRLPSLSGQDMNYLMDATKAYGDGRREHAEMSAVTTALLEQDPSNLKNVIGYYANKTAQQPPQRLPQRPVITAVKQCNTCHGEKGRSINVRIPRLDGQSEGYLVNVMNSYLNLERSHEGMNIIARQLTMMEIRGLAKYYAEH